MCTGIRIRMYRYMYMYIYVYSIHLPSSSWPRAQDLRNFDEIWTKIGRNFRNVDEISTKFEGFPEYPHIHVSTYIYIYIYIYMDFLRIHINNCELNDGRGPHENSPNS